MFQNSDGYTLQMSVDATATLERLPDDCNSNLLIEVKAIDNYHAFWKQLDKTDMQQWYALIADQRHSGISLALMYDIVHRLLQI